MTAKTYRVHAQIIRTYVLDVVAVNPKQACDKVGEMDVHKIEEFGNHEDTTVDYIEIVEE